ncbi:MAG: GNAT family N-acetyltransferase [Burkholderiales bacterium]|nr:GNAT family N-acetyltransferase [Burkholderiales bacterium]
MNHPTTTPALTIRSLTRDDLPEVIAIDAAIEGHSRRTYVERRLAAALREPALHAQFAACDGEGLVGYLLARVLAGEFGRSSAGLRLELVGVRPDRQRMGAGRQLFGLLLQWAARHGVGELRTIAPWNKGAMLGWLHASGFRLAPEVVLEMNPRQDAPAAEPDVTVARGETNFGTPETNDHERMARDAVEIRTLLPSDMAEILRIDHAVTGRDRDAYIRALLVETTEASRTRVSLVGRLDQAIVGFVMARADIGDYGRTEPVAVLDTIGVDPDYAGSGIGSALLGQLAANVLQLQVERLETVVKVSDLELLGFFQAVGFGATQRLSFVRGVAA